jgi:DNA-directed RNA polymerase beta subunit/intein/homing endonuclease
MAADFDQDEFDECTWSLIDCYFANNKGHQLVKHQLESFNDFILRKLDQIIDGFNSIEIQHQFIPELCKFKYILIVNIRNPIVNKPIIYEKDGSTKTMTPNDARQRNFTYSSNLTVDVHITAKSLSEDGLYAEDTKELKNVLLGKIPIMVKSNYCILNNKFALVNGHECKYDYGAYFIINGNEKVIISQDRISENKTYVFVNNKVSTYSHIAEIRSVQENKLGVPKITTLRLSAKANQFGRYIRVNIHHIKNEIPIFILFKALGLRNDKEILHHITYNLDDSLSQVLVNELIGSVEEANNIQCPKDALEYLSKYLNITGYPKEILNNKVQRINIVRNVLSTEFLPHVGMEFHKKALYLGYMVNKLLKCFLEIKEFDDRDSYINKKIDTPGVLMANLFRQYYGKVIKDMKNMIQKEINVGGWKATNKFINVINKVNIYKIVKSTIIDSGMRYALATGNWGIKNNKNKQGVAQVLNRMTYSATISHMRRINTPIEKSGKLVQPRKLHPTQWGIICPSECFDPDTPILLWSGIIKKAKDIIVGDYLIDDKGYSTKVKSTCSGFKTMYEIIPYKSNFMKHTVTDNHILTLKSRIHTRNPNKSTKKYNLRWFDKDISRYTSKLFDKEEDLENFKSEIDDVIDITIEKYLSLPKNVQKELYLFKSDGINWEYEKVVLDPYILGMWLGDGSSSGYEFTTADKELLDKWIEWGADNDATIKKGYKYKYTISSTINNTQTGISCNKTEKAPLKKLLDKYYLTNNKHIPINYLVNDRKTRLSVLAGLVDTDGNVRPNGHEIRICQGEDNYQIIYDAEFLVRSLGFSCHVNDGISTYTVNGEKRQTPYKELYITGANLYEIPTVLPRKKLKKFDNPTSIKKCFSHLQSSFKLVKKEIQPFVGWQVEGNGRFLLGDTVISHNTPEGASVGLVKNMSMICSITISSNSINVREIIKEFGVEVFTGENIHIFHDNTKVIVNGDIVGVHRDPPTFYEKLKQEKLAGTINIYTSVLWNIKEKEIQICTEGGRCVRPCYIIQDGKPKFTDDIVKALKNKTITWKDILVNHRMIEFLDVEETNTAMIGMKYQDILKGKKGSLLPIKYTHLEIHPSLILGVLASTIPFSDHNQAPRNCLPVKDHEVLTKYGFIGFDKIIEYTSDGKKLSVACYVNGNLEYHDISRDGVVYQDDYNQPLTATEFVSFESKIITNSYDKSKGISLLATTNHNMYGRLGFADKLGENSYRYRSVPPDYKTYQAGEVVKFGEQDIPAAKVPEGSKAVPVFQLQCNFNNGITILKEDLPFIKALDLVTDDQIDAFLWLYGYWLGSSEELEGTHAPSKDIEKLTEIFNRSNMNTGLWNYFASQYSSLQQTEEKWFWPWVFDSLDISKLKIILSGLRFADGTEESLQGGTIYTSSSRFRNEVERVCILAGYSVLTHQDCSNQKWAVTYTTASVSSTPYLQIGDEIKIVKFEEPEKVFCVTVPTESHLIMVRRKINDELSSRPTIIHNCYQCLDPDTLVLMADNTHKAIKDIKIGEEVFTFHPETKEITTSKIINQYVRPTDKKIMKITTVSGREIIATEDHKFMTNEGWKRVYEFDDNTKIGVAIYSPAPIDTNIYDVYDILTIESFSNILENYDISIKLISTHINKLVDLNLLPLKSNDKRLPIIARVVGFTMTDGSISIYKKGNGVTTQSGYNFGSYKDAEIFENDIQQIGFSKMKISESNRILHDTLRHTFRANHSALLGNFLLTLGVTPGKNTEVERLPVPDWIMNGSKNIKKEFLAAFQGGDGCKIYHNKRRRISTGPMNQLIKPEYEESLVNFIKQMMILFEEFDIDVTFKTKKYSETRIKLGYKISDSHANLIKCFETIGYRYDSHKLIDSAKIIEYLKYKDYKNNPIRSDIWIQNIEHQASSIFVPIKSITEVSNRLIADITTESENHSFIAAGGLLSSNSAQAKQAIGIYALNFRHRYDTLGHVLHYPQKPIIKTHMASILNTDTMPNGINAIVAIACYTGFNMEDSCILNKSAVDRGLFVSTYYRTYKEQNNKNHSNGEEEFFTKPEVKALKSYNYDKLTKDGFVPENTYVEGGDIIIGKCMPNKIGNVINYKDNSIGFKHNDRGYIDSNAYGDKKFCNVNGDGYTFAKVRVRSDRVPTIGDKFSCYDDQTELLTDEGWLFFKDLKYTHKVASLVNEQLVYQYPTDIICDDFTGKLYRIDTEFIDLKVTDNHRMYIKEYDKYIIKEAKDIILPVYYKKNLDLWDPETRYLIDNFKDVKADFQELCLQAGYSADKISYEDYLIYSKPLQNEPLINSFMWEDYTGKVYCCTVPEGPGIIYVRRNGKVCWSGNSRSGQHRPR